MKRALTMAILGTLSCAVPARAQVQIQQNPARLSEYVELGGNGIFTLNGEVQIAHNLSLRLGGMFIPITDDHLPVSGVAMVNKLVGRDGRYLEIGAGIAAFGQLSSSPCARCLLSGPTATIGYRREAHHMIHRVTFAPVFVHDKGRRWLPMVGVSGGRTW